MGRKLGSKNGVKSNRGAIFKHKDYKLAKFIIDKFIDIRQKNPWRDLPICYQLIKKYPNETFWRALPCEFRIPAMTYLTYEKAAAKLKLLYAVYSKNLSRDKKIKIDTAPLIEYKLEETDIEENLITKRKPKTILEFCK